MSQHEAFWKRYPGLVWSNPDAGDDVRIRAALLRPRVLELLDIAHEFGLERVRAEWRALREEGTSEARRAEPIAERILGNIERGAALAAAATMDPGRPAAVESARHEVDTVR